MKTVVDTVKAWFLKDVAWHEMTILRDEGLYRHVRFSRPKSNVLQFDLITWPGHLAYCGDMGSFIFSRVEDMFRWFGRDWTKANFGYWGEKCLAVDKADGIRQWSKKIFNDSVRQQIEGYFSENSEKIRLCLKKAREDRIFSCENECEAHEAYSEFRFDGGNPLECMWESPCTESTYRFAWCCVAIPWGLNLYWKSKETSEIKAA